ncbi:MAG: glycosyltransferase family 2 protein [Calditrichaeota bacterium]|nr:glycosyltransferase family 2 protein [Calditrichota bacterium]
MLEIVGGILFWVGLLGLLHTYIFYPLSLLLLAPKSPPPPEEPREWPKISILVPAYNEETHIGAKIENCLALDYPLDKLEILIGSDCSTDRTAGIVKSYGDSRVRLFEMERRSGKVGVLNRLASEARGEIFLFTDANTHLHKVAARMLARHFGNLDVGAVSGRSDKIPPRGVAAVRGEALYRKFEISLKRMESNLGGTCGAFGALYAIRRTQFTPFPTDGQHDDMVQLLRTVQQGKRVLFEPMAVSSEETETSISGEFHRRARFGIGNYQTLAKMGHMIHPRYGATAYVFFSHKVLRWLSPFLLLAVFVGSLMLQDFLFYKIVLGLQIAFYGLAAIGGIMNQLGICLPGITLIFHFAALNFAFVLSFFRWLRGRRGIIWERSGRAASATLL